MMIPAELGRLLQDGRSFLLTTHKDPDCDGIGSMLALGRSLQMAGKETALVLDAPVSGVLRRLAGSGRIVQPHQRNGTPDAMVMLDCAEFGRAGRAVTVTQSHSPVVNIDHHATNDLFGDFNWVEPASSSTGEMVYRLLKWTKLPMDYEVAENLFLAIQSDTGSFRYDNTTAETLRTAAALIEDYGIKPWDAARKIMDEHSPARLRLLRLALDTLELHCHDRLAAMTVTRDMFQAAGAERPDSEQFVDYPRFMAGVEVGVLIRQSGENEYKFSLRSNQWVDVARLAQRFGGGGHARAAGFDLHGGLDDVKAAFLTEAAAFLGEHGA